MKTSFLKKGLSFTAIFICGQLLSACDQADKSISAGSAPNAPMTLEEQGEGASLEFMRPKGEARTIEFDVDEATQLSLDISPDGKWLVMDLLGHVWRLSAEGGEAVSLTQGSGIALNFHPVYSPDGSKIAFVSDRSGQNNIWVMNADGSNPRALLLDMDSRFSDPVWAPDGKSLVAVRTFPSPGRGWHRRNMTLWKLPVNGDGEPEEVKADLIGHYTAPDFSPDGQSLYYDVAYSTWNGNGLLKAGHRIQKYDFSTQTTENVRLDEPVEISEEYKQALAATGYAAGVQGDKAAAMSPAISPDGKWMAFAQEVLDEDFTFRGHQFGPKTTLILRNLETGEERRLIDEATKDATKVNAQYSYRVFPGYAWTPDGKALIAAYKGKIHRIDIATGAEKVIPFKAHIQREISAQVRSKIDIEPNMKVQFIQWPTSSPDGSKIVFVAAGRLWLVNEANGKPRPLTKDMLPTFQYTPAWSPDGKKIAFTTWDNNTGGGLWTVNADGSQAKKISTGQDAFIFPTWYPDGQSIVVTQGSGRGFSTSPFPVYSDDPAHWSLMLYTDDGSRSRLITNGLGFAKAAVFGPGYRLFYRYQEDISSAKDLHSPYPSAAAMAQNVKVKSIDLYGLDAKDHLIFPPRKDFAFASSGSNRPVISLDGKWVAFESAGSIYVQPVPSLNEMNIINSDPNVEVANRIRLGDQGGTYPSWRNEHILQFVSGNTYFTYDVSNGQLNERKIELNIRRDTAKGILALKGAKIITIKGDEVIEKGDILISNGRISCVGECDTSAADHTLDVTGKVISPGFVDVHAHQTTYDYGIVTQHYAPLALSLAYGVTTVIDPATVSQGAFPLAELADTGLIRGPRTYSSAEFVITQSTAWGDNLEITSAENAEYNVRRRANWGARQIKNYRLASRQAHQYLIEASREWPLTVTSEGGPLLANIGFAMDGQTGWEHLIAQIPLYADGAEFLGRAAMHYPPTVSVAGHVNGAKEYFRPRQGLLQDEKYNRFISGADLGLMHRFLPDLPKNKFSFAILAEGMADIIRAGGYGALGEHGEQPGIGTHWEIWAYAEALSPLDVLKVATLHGAHFIGLDHEIGSVEPGKLADLIIFNRDPLENIRHTEDIAYVLKGGVLYDDDTLDRVWPKPEKYQYRKP